MHGKGLHHNLDKIGTCFDNHTINLKL